MKMMTYPKLPLLGGIRKSHTDATSSVIPPSDHLAVETFDDLFSSCSCLQPRSGYEGKRWYWLYQNLTTNLTNAMILGGLLNLVWKNRLLITRWGETRADKALHSHVNNHFNTA
jgi:hypothetical protein